MKPELATSSAHHVLRVVLKRLSEASDELHRSRMPQMANPFGVYR